MSTYRRRVAVACAVAAIGAGWAVWGERAGGAARAEDKPPVMLKGGVSETVDLTRKDPRDVRGWATRAREQAQGQRDQEIKKFMSNPFVHRVTHVEPVRDGQEKQMIYAHLVTQVTISEDGKVDLGKVVPKSGSNFSVPPETLKVGDLFTMQDNQFVKVPKDHFDPLGALSEIGKQVVEIDPRTKLMGMAVEMDRVATMLEDKALEESTKAARSAGTAGQHFLEGAAEAVGQTLEYLAQPRGDFGKPGKPLQDLMDYLTHDYNDNNDKMWQAAVQAVDEFQKDPARALGKQVPNMVPMGSALKEVQAAKALAAAKRVSEAAKVVEDMAKLEAASAKAAMARAAAKAEAAAQKGAVAGKEAGAAAKGAAEGGAALKGGVPDGGGFGNMHDLGGVKEGTLVGRTEKGTPVPMTGETNQVNPTKWKSPVKGVAPSPVRVAGAPELNPFQDFENCFDAAMAQDKAWATGEKTVALPAEATGPIYRDAKVVAPNVSPEKPFPVYEKLENNRIPVAKAKEKLKKMTAAYGAKDPMHGETGLQNAQMGLATPTSPKALKDAFDAMPDGSRGLLFTEGGVEKSGHVVNVRKVNGKMEVWDPQSDTPWQLDENAQMLFFRTN